MVCDTAPFDDGNGRITRTLTDLALAQMDQQSIRLYTMSPVILNKRKSYYKILEATQKGDSDITAWLLWFLQALNESLEHTLKRIEMTLLKSTFWQTFSEVDLHEGQRKVLNRLLDSGENGCIVKLEGGGRNTRYQIKQIW